jgi:hypothetical protein
MPLWSRRYGAPVDAPELPDHPLDLPADMRPFVCVMKPFAESRLSILEFETVYLALWPTLSGGGESFRILERLFFALDEQNSDDAGAADALRPLVKDSLSALARLV